MLKPNLLLCPQAVVTNLCIPTYWKHIWFQGHCSLSLMSCHLFNCLVSSFTPLCLTMDSQFKNAYIPLVKMCSMASRVVITWNTLRNVESWVPPQTNYITMCMFNKILAGLISSWKFESICLLNTSPLGCLKLRLIKIPCPISPHALYSSPLSFLCSWN